MRAIIPTKTPSEIDWARLAAFIDGEGCLRICSKLMKRSRGHRFSYAELLIANTNPRLILWLKETFGVGCIKTRTRKNPNWSDCYWWSVTCGQVMWIMEHTLPYFVIKRDQAEVMLAFQATVKKRPGVRGLPEEVHEKRWELRNHLIELKGKSSRGTLQDRFKGTNQEATPVAETVN